MILVTTRAIARATALGSPYRAILLACDTGVRQSDGAFSCSNGVWRPSTKRVCYRRKTFAGTRMRQDAP